MTTYTESLEKKISKLQRYEWENKALREENKMLIESLKKAQAKNNDEVLEVAVKNGFITRS